MTLQLTDEQVKRMGQLAVLASKPMGLGWMHYGSELNPEEIKFSGDEWRPDDKSNPGFFIDYYQGRMVKFRGWKEAEGAWEFPDSISPDYESWVSKYSSYAELADAARR